MREELCKSDAGFWITQSFRVIYGGFSYGGFSYGGFAVLSPVLLVTIIT